MSGWVTGLIVATAVGLALSAGTYFAFSTFVTPALAALPSDEAVRSMQSINAVILGSLFMPVFGGTAVLGAAALIASFATGAPTPVRVALGVALGLYLIGVVGVTIVGNVPLNDALMAFREGDARAAWDAYYGPWMRLNHVRTFASSAALVATLLALRA